MELYAIKDVYSGFADPVCFLNRSLAVDSFRQLVRELPELPSVPLKVSDISLYCLGSFDNDSGYITPITPTLIVEGSNFIKGDESNNVQILQTSEAD